VTHPTPDQQEYYVFDEFEVDVRQRVLLRSGDAVSLPSKVFSVLLAFVRNPGVELSKEFLIRTVWPDSCVEESNLTQSIFLLRRALGQRLDGRRRIVTIPGQGYLFAGDVQAKHRIQSTRPISDSLPRTRSIAVLPLHVLDAAKDVQYLGVGIADTLIDQLSHIEQIDVRPTGSVLRYADPAHNSQDVGRELGVSLLITGTVYVERNPAGSPSQIRVTVQIVNVLDGTLVWSDALKHDLSQILTLQDTLAEKVGRALMTRMTAQEQKELVKRYTDDSDAYQNYLKGRYYAGQWTIRGWMKAIECFSKAVQLDPNYALAYCGMADAHYMASNLYASPTEAMAKAQIAITHALALDSSLAEAHTSAALVKAFFEWNWIEAESSFRRAISLNPKSAPAYLWYGRLLTTSGRFDEAIDILRKGQRLDPLSSAVNAELGRTLYCARRFSDATEQLRETLELDPNFWPAHLFLGWIYEQQGHFTEAIAILRRSSRLDDNPRTKASLGVAYAFAGNETDAEKVLISLMETSKKRYVSAYYIAAIHLALGDKTRAFRYFAKAYADKSEWLVWLRVDPRFDPFRQDPRFADLINKVGIPAHPHPALEELGKSSQSGLTATTNPLPS
jgi:DNA-binding winged helix-turn-helix (wHTH) protein/tetratricopeptide (TPR) repeat protein